MFWNPKSVFSFPFSFRSGIAGRRRRSRSNVSLHGESVAAEIQVLEARLLLSINPVLPAKRSAMKLWQSLRGPGITFLQVFSCSPMGGS